MVGVISKRKPVGGCAACLAILLWSAAPAAFADEVAGRVTASIEPERAGSIIDGERLKLGEGDACSILLDDDAVVELCGQASVVFKRDRESNRRIVALEGGEIRIIVEPRGLDERIEIHTPAVIATLLGTIVHASVDPNSGETTITSAQSSVSVRSDEPTVRGTTVLTAGEQVTVEPGEAPPAQPKRLDPQEISELGGCLVDFHLAAAGRDSHESGERVTDRLTAVDAAANAGLPAGAAAFDRPGGPPTDEPGDPLTGQEGACVTPDCESYRDLGYDSQVPPRFLKLQFAN